MFLLLSSTADERVESQDSGGNEMLVFVYPRKGLWSVFTRAGGSVTISAPLYSQACCTSEAIPWPYFPLTLDHDCIPSSKRRESLCQEFHVEIVDHFDASQLVITAPHTLIRLAKTSILQASGNSVITAKPF